MNATAHFRSLLLASLLATAYPLEAQAPSNQHPIRIDPGPQLFFDDYLVEEQSFLLRTVNQPDKLPQPIIGAAASGDRCFQPYVSVLRDPSSGKFRMWYGIPESENQSHVAYVESEDGLHWLRPPRILKDPYRIQFGVSVVDRGESYPDPAGRYVLGFYQDGGLMIAASADGFDWKLAVPRPVLMHNHDINSIDWDPIRKRYIAIVSMYEEGEHYKGKRRIPYQSVSTDLFAWKKPWKVLTPKIGAPVERGETEFYAMAGIVARGRLLIGLVKILRDDLNATPGRGAAEMGETNRKAAGLGYTALAWSHDGETWQRDYEAFLPNNPVPGSWDHAMAWGDKHMVVGKETLVYYGGYARGHKVARFEERQLGLARMPRDRYVSRDADLNEGLLRTKRVLMAGKSLTVNANVAGSLRLRLIDDTAKSLPGYDWVDIHGDSVEHAVKWNAPLPSRPVRIEFRLQQAQLFGFDLQ